MNLFTIFCICFVLSFVWEKYLQIINYRYTQKPKLKDTAKELFELSYKDSEKALSYSKDRFFFGLVSSSVTNILYLALIFTGTFALVEKLAQGVSASYLPFLSNNSLLAEGLVFFVICILASIVINIPLSYYSHFVIEEKHGFNKMTRKIFVADILKSTLLTLTLAGIFLSTLLIFITHFEKLWWLYGWIFTSLFMLVVAWIYPTLIQPLFNTLTPLEKDGELNQSLRELAKKADFNMSDIYTMNASIRSTHGNAYFAGMFKKKKIVLFDTLVETLRPKQVAAVLAHELGHFKLNHIRWGTVRGTIQMGILFWLVSYLASSPDMITGFGFSEEKPYIVLLFFFLWQGILNNVFTPIMSYISRKDEFAADAYAASMVDGNDLIGGLLALSKKSNHFPFYHPLYSTVYHSHPPLAERAEAIKKAMQTLPT